MMIKNKMTGEWLPAPDGLIRAMINYDNAKEAFMIYKNVFHDYASPESANIYMALLENWDIALKQFGFWANIHCIMTEGYSLN